MEASMCIVVSHSNAFICSYLTYCNAISCKIKHLLLDTIIASPDVSRLGFQFVESNKISHCFDTVVRIAATGLESFLLDIMIYAFVNPRMDESDFAPASVTNQILQQFWCIICQNYRIASEFICGESIWTYCKWITSSGI